MIAQQETIQDCWLQKVTNSSLWAAYADALGFITELADENRLQHRVGRTKVESLSSWKRKIGGLYGVSVELPKGTYSDDTQLRLSVSRAIGYNGTFDIDSFACIELPVWMSYQLGGGISTNIAAKNLTKKSVSWATNFFDTKKSSYINGGGNGAAMRIQPHVWSHPAQQRSIDLITNIFSNAVCTHGSPRGILGALFHGYCLYYAMVEDHAPTPTDWKKFLFELKNVPAIIKEDSMLGFVWLPTWEQAANISFSTAWESTIDEMLKDIATITPLIEDNTSSYHDIIATLGCYEAKWRGTGTKTALLASTLVLISNQNPLLCAQLAANALQSDTDTIGTMAAAIAGALSSVPPSEKVQDYDYICQEAKKLTNIRYSIPANIFIYPAINSWKAPKSNVDVIYSDSNQLYISGLGSAKAISAPIFTKTKEFCWEWISTDFKQTMLVKRRATPEEGVPPIGRYKAPSNNKIQHSSTLLNTTHQSSANSLNELLNDVLASHFSHEVIGKKLLEAANDEQYGLEKAIALTTKIISNYKK